jgi:hypothetical protein
MFSSNFIKVTAISFLSLTGVAMASSIECSNPQATVKYNAQLVDGGANRENNINWTIDGKNLMQESSLEIVAPGGGGFQRPAPEVYSEFSLSEDIEGHLDASNPNYPLKVTTFYALAKVTSIATQESLFEGFMICISHKYNGVPRP